MKQVRKEYNISIDRSSNPDSYTVALFIWKGNINDVPELSTYTTTKFNPNDKTDLDYIDVSELISDYIEQEVPNFNEGLNNYYNTVWFKYDIYYDDDEVPSTSIVESCVYGYEDSGNNILLDGSELSMYDTFLLPVKTGNEVVISSYPNNEADANYTLLESEESSEQIRIIKINRPANDTFICVEVDEEKVYIYPERETRYGVNNIVYENSKGCIQLLPFMNKREDKTNVEREVYKVKSSSSGHNYKNYNVNGRGSFELSTSFHSECSNPAFESLLLSENIWLENEENEPINIDSSSISYKNRLNDSLISYDISFKYSKDKVNT